MECNKDEAVKAKEVAEKKFDEKDLTEARKCAMKAQSLFPGLDGLEPLLATLNIYLSAERKVNGEVDWYGVLGVDPSSDDETVKKQYSKLALTFHPGRNKSLGAEGAFKILSEAWSLLSDKANREAYNVKRSSRNMYEKVNNGKFNTSQKAPNHNSNSVPPPRRDTFWTKCTSCKLQFEYVLFYLNKNLECYNCKKPFLAIRIPPPQTNPQPPGTAGYSGSAVKRPHAGEANGSCSAVKGEKPKRRRRASEPKVNGGGSGKNDPILMGNNLNGFQNGDTETPKVTFSGSRLPAVSRELSLHETRNMLMAKATGEICKKLNEWKNIDLMTKASNDKANTKEKFSALRTQQKADANGVGRKPGPNARLKHSNGSLKTSSLSNSKANSEVIEQISSSMIVSDPDFHDFDKDRTEKSFGDNQVWAADDNDDGMPRFYAMIHTVISRKPFKMHISWLNSKSTTEFGSLNWVGSGFYKTSGDFRVGKYEMNKTVNAFSHKVKWTKGTRGVIQIYPRKGDVWALYRNWSPEWNEHTPDDVIHQYDMFEVVDDYIEEKGVTVIPLVKVTGFKTVFHQHKDREQVKVIPREEMFRFSHQVPALLLTSNESVNAPKGCWELDPAATPVELLKRDEKEKLESIADLQ